MSLPIAVGDLITVINLGFQIYEKCFTKAQAADQKYLQFGEEIRNLSESLKQLNNVFGHVEQERQTRSGLPYDAAQVKLTLKPLPDLTGDFAKTLNECRKLLSDNSKFRHNAAGFVDNVRWWLGVEAEVESLKQRIRFHTTKILLITKPVELQLLSDLQKDVMAVHKDVRAVWTVVEEIREHQLNPNAEQTARQQEQPSLRLPQVPPELETRFVAAVSAKAGVHIDLKDFPLKEGFDALVFHFAESTVDFIPREYSTQRTPELTQYLNLIKSRWILQRLQESSYFVRDSLWARCIKDVEINILREYRRFDSGKITSPSTDVIARLQEHCFSIWIDDHGTEVVPTLVDERASEEKLLEITLPQLQNNRKQLLVVFRKSDHELRFAHITKDDQNESFYEAEGHEIDIQSTRFIPLYAVPGSVSSTSTNNLLFCNNQGQGENSYSLQRLEDVHSLQQAVTGYKVAADLTNVSWNTFKSSETGQGRVQVWQAKPLPRMTLGQDAIKTQSPKAGLPRQGTSFSSFTLAESVAATAKGSLIYGSSGPAVLFSKPEAPMVVIYTLFKDRWTFLHFELDRTVYINTESCHCRECKASKKIMCCRVIIETKGKLKIKRHSADIKDGVNTWNLALLRKPQHPKATASMSPMPVKYVFLTFQTTQDKSDFQTAFKDTQTLRNLDDTDYLTAIART